MYMKKKKKQNDKRDKPLDLSGKNRNIIFIHRYSRSIADRKYWWIKNLHCSLIVKSQKIIIDTCIEVFYSIKIKNNSIVDFLSLKFLRIKSNVFARFLMFNFFVLLKYDYKNMFNTKRFGSWYFLF